jgi:ankyrin repeat protein
MAARIETLETVDMAAQSGLLTNVQYLVEKGADINAKDKKGQTALHISIKNESFYHNGSFHFYAPPDKLVEYPETNPLKTVQYLLEKRADINAKDDQGWTALHMAVRRGALVYVQYLVEQGVDIKAKDKEGRTALHLAAGSGFLNTVQYLVEQGADIEAKDEQGETALHMATCNASADIPSECLVDTGNRPGGTVQYLLEQGADKEAKNNNGEKAIDIVLKSNHSDHCNPGIFRWLERLFG